MTDDKKSRDIQIDSFKETARALGCDEDKEKFEATLRKIASSRRKTEKVKKATHKV
jgi:hypothetical protein